MILLQNKDTGLAKECTTGYSWTTFFFGAFVPLLRGDLKWACIIFIVSIIVSGFTMLLGAFFVGPIFGIFYNKIYISDLMSKGFIPADEDSYDWCVRNGLLSSRVPRPTTKEH